MGTINLSKITLEKRGDTISLSKKFTRIETKLIWTKAVDLDMHAFYVTKNGKFGHIYFANKGSLRKSPFISLDKDAGVGNTAGNNEENMTIGSLDDIEKLIIATNIFRFLGFLNKGDNFAKYDGKVVVKTDSGDHIEVPLTSEESGKWCIIAEIDNSNPHAPKISNVNRVQKNEPKKEDL